MSVELETCTRCGQVHPQPFAEEVIQAFQRVMKAPDTDKGSCIMEMVQEYAATFDSSNHQMNDEFHHMIDQFIAHQIQFQQTTMRVGRVLMRSLDKFLQEEAERMKGEPKPPYLN